MVETQLGLNDIRDFLDGHIDEIAVGTGTGTPNKNDTALENEVLRKSASVSDKAPGEVTHQIRVLASEANNEDLTEAGEYDADPELQNREVFSALPKTSDFEVIINFKQTVSNA